MKRLHFRFFAGVLTLTAELIHVTGCAQEDALPEESPYTLSTHEQIHGGLRGGLGLSAPISGTELSGSSALSWTIGAMGLLKLNKRHQFELGVSYQRVSSLLQDKNAASENKMNLSLITTTLSIRRTGVVARGHGALSDLYLSLGPGISYWVGGSGTFSSPAGNADYTLDFVQAIDTAAASFQAKGAARWLLCTDLGVGLSVPVARNQRIFLELRGSLGITPLGSEASAAYLKAPGFSTSHADQALQQRLNTLWFTATYTFVHNTMQSKMGRSTKEKQVMRRDPRKQKKDRSYLNTRIKKSRK